MSVARIIVPMLCLAVLLFAFGEAPACPNCQAGVASETNNEALAAGMGNPALGYNVSILFMMAMPFLIVAGFATACYRLCKKQQESGRLDAPLAVVEANCEDVP